MSKKDAAIYLRAAELLDSGVAVWPGSCCAIQETARPDRDCGCTTDPYPAVTKYRLRFKPEGSQLTTLWGDFWPDPKGCRVLALCFAAAMAEAGDL